MELNKNLSCAGGLRVPSESVVGDPAGEWEGPRVPLPAPLLSPVALGLPGARLRGELHGGDLQVHQITIEKTCTVHLRMELCRTCFKSLLFYTASLL